MSKNMGFLNDFNKSVDKIDGVGRSSQPPRYWYPTGNYVLNKIISGSFLKGIPQGRITTLTGPSSSGKSFVACNIMREAQKAGAFILVVDSENALDDDFVSAIGVDPENNYNYVGVTTIPQAQKVISSFLKGYKKEYGDDVDAPQVLVVIDSLSMLMTETEVENYNKGVTKGDQGQRNKQLKAMLRSFVQDIKSLNVTMINTAQVYANQNVLNGEGVWIVPDAVKYSASQIVMLSKLKLRDTGSKDIHGIRMKCEGYKTRFAKPFQVVTIEVPYDTGIDPFNGLLEVAVNMDLVEKKGSRFAVAGDDKTWYSKDFNEYAPDVLIKAEANSEHFIDVLDDEDVEEKDAGKSAKSKRKAKAGVE